MRSRVGANRSGVAPRGDRARRSRGVALIEFALVFPVLALLVFGTVDLGRAYSMKNRMRNAAREAGIYAQANPTRLVHEAATACADPNNATYRALEELNAAGDAADGPFVVKFNSSEPAPIIPASCGDWPEAADLEAGDVLQITVEGDFDVVTPLVSAITGETVGITETIEVVIQG